MINLSYKKFIKRIMTTVLSAVCMLVMGGCGTYNAEITWELEESPATCQETTTASVQEEEVQQMICVYVSGAVNSGGVFYLPEGSRLYHAIEAAGGMTEDADTDSLNQARILTDGEQIRVLTVEESQSVREQSSQSVAATPGLVNINTADAAQLTSLSGIGESRAEAIIAYREQCGRFAKIEDIQNVTGIKSGLYEKIKDKITVG